MTGLMGVIRGASGGHCDTAFASKMSMVISPLVRGRIPTFVESVNTVVTQETSVDVVVTEIGIAINPNRQDLIRTLQRVRCASIHNQRITRKKSIQHRWKPRTNPIW